MTFTAELGCRAKGFLLFDRLVIQRCEQAEAPELRGMIPGVGKKSPASREQRFGWHLALVGTSRPVRGKTT